MKIKHFKGQKVKSKYFKAYELVSNEDYEKMGDAKVWEIFDSGIIEAIDTIKEHFSARNYNNK